MNGVNQALTGAWTQDSSHEFGQVTIHFALIARLTIHQLAYLLTTGLHRMEFDEVFRLVSQSSRRAGLLLLAILVSFFLTTPRVLREQVFQQTLNS